MYSINSKITDLYSLRFNNFHIQVMDSSVFVTDVLNINRRVDTHVKLQDIWICHEVMWYAVLFRPKFPGRYSILICGSILRDPGSRHLQSLIYS